MNFNCCCRLVSKDTWNDESGATRQDAEEAMHDHFTESTLTVVSAWYLRRPGKMSLMQRIKMRRRPCMSIAESTLTVC